MSSVLVALGKNIKSVVVNSCWHKWRNCIANKTESLFVYASLTSEESRSITGRGLLICAFERPWR